MKDKTMLLQIVVPFLGDVRAEAGVATIGVFDGVYSQHAGYQRIGIRLAIRNQVDTLAGCAASVASVVSLVQRRAREATRRAARQGGRRHWCGRGTRGGGWPRGGRWAQGRS